MRQNLIINKLNFYEVGLKGGQSNYFGEDLYKINPLR
jgi:hypothetical protein